MERTRVVRWLRVILPLLALALLSGLFLLGRRADERAVPYVTGGQGAEVAAGIVAPTYTTVTADGATVRLHARSAQPAGAHGARSPGAGAPGGGAPAAGTAQGVTFDWQSPEGLALTLGAASGAVDGGRVTLDGGVTVNSSSGYRIEISRLVADTRAGVLTGDGPLRAEAPFGHLTAGAMRLARAAGSAAARPEGADSPAAGTAAGMAAASYVLDFTGGVRLLYQP